MRSPNRHAANASSRRADRQCAQDAEPYFKNFRIEEWRCFRYSLNLSHVPWWKELWWFLSSIDWPRLGGLLARSVMLR
jgi:hypothetical protein